MNRPEPTETRVRERTPQAQAVRGAESDPAPRMPSGGLISTILGQAPAPAGDEGALAALRTLPRRAAADPDWNDPVEAEERAASRIELLLALARDQRGPARARLLTQAAELMQQQSEHERAATAYAEALEADPSQRAAALQVRRQHLRQGRLQDAARAFARVAETASDARERCLAWCALAEVELALNRGLERCLETLQRASTENPRSSLPALLSAQLELRAGRLGDFAASLTRAAATVDREGTRALFSLEAGRAHERAQRPELALACYREAATCGTTALGALLGAARLHIAAGDRSAAAESLRELAAASGETPLALEWQRQFGLRLLDGVGDAAAAARALQSLETPSGMRAFTRACEASGEERDYEAAFETWVRASGGILRPAPNADASGQYAPAAAPAESVEQLTPYGERLRRAALACANPEAHDRAEELRLLCDQPTRNAERICADVAAFDAAAELGSWSQLWRAAAREAEHWQPKRAAFAALAALELAAFDEHAPAAERRALLDALRANARGEPAVTRAALSHGATPAERAQLWLAEAEAARGSRAAYAASQAGLELERAGDAAGAAMDAYGEALRAVPGYFPAALGLEITARHLGDLDALERVQREIADTCAWENERAARLVRLGLLHADADPAAAARQLDLVTAAGHDDAVLDELSIRLARSEGPSQEAKVLESIAARQASSAFTRALRLRAAAAREDAGQWDEALDAYRRLLADDPADEFAEAALLCALRHSGRAEALAEELDQRIRRCDDAPRRALWLEELAHIEERRGLTQRSRMLLERVIAGDPNHRSVSALRSLQRDALQSGDEARIAHWSLQLSEALEDADARGAELRLAVRACRHSGGDLDQTLLSAEGRVHEPWYALELEALSIRTGDRARLYEALRVLSQPESEPKPIARAAYALRAAEVLESAAPERAARELAGALTGAPGYALALEQLARLYKTAGELHAAAETFERAAQANQAQRRAAMLHYTAGVLFQDELDDPERAIENLLLTAHADLSFGDTFARLRQLFERTGRKRERAVLIESRLALPIDAQLAEELHWERHDLCLELGLWAEAKQSALALLELTPQSQPALSALAELQLRLGEPGAAAETLQRAMGSLVTADDLAPVLMRLANVLAQHLRDPERAQSALKRALQLKPDEPRALEQLAFLYARAGRQQEALHTAARLLAGAPSGPAWERAVITHASLLEQLGQALAARDALAQARVQAPASLPLLRAQSALLERQGDVEEHAAQLLHGCDALRAAIVREPGELAHWLGLCELLHMRGRPDAARLIGQTARAFGLEDPALPADEPEGKRARGAVDPTLLTRLQPLLAPDGVLGPLRVLLCELGYALEAQLPFATESEPLAEQLVPVITEELAPLLPTLEPSDLQLLTCEGLKCVPLSSTPLKLCVGQAWFELKPAERRFALWHAVAVAQFDLALIARSSPARLGLVLNALWRSADPARSQPLATAAEQGRIEAELTKRIAPYQRARALNLFESLPADADLTPERLIALAFDAGTRVALTVCGDVGAAIAYLLQLRTSTPGTDAPRAINELCHVDAGLRGLLQFAISEAHADARREVTQPSPAQVN